jgi:hypothetical protein
MPTVTNITATTLVKAGSGKVKNYSVLVAGSTAGNLNDAAATDAGSTVNPFVALPAQVGSGSFGPAGWAFVRGLVVVPGAGQTISVDFE